MAVQWSKKGCMNWELGRQEQEDVEVEVKLLLHISRNLGCQGKVFEVA